MSESDIIAMLSRHWEQRFPIDREARFYQLYAAYRVGIDRAVRRRLATEWRVTECRVRQVEQQFLYALRRCHTKPEVVNFINEIPELSRVVYGGSNR